MKTAEEWNIPTISPDLVREIQLDARQSAFKEAADMIIAERNKSYTEDRNPLSVLVDLQKAILAHAEKELKP